MTISPFVEGDYQAFGVPNSFTRNLMNLMNRVQAARDVLGNLTTYS